MRRLIIDGYNVLRSAARYAAFGVDDLDEARERLIADLGSRVVEGQSVTVVFDGAGNPGSDGIPRISGGVTVIFSPHGVEADAVIESLAAEARINGDETLIVTSDTATRWTAVGGAVTVLRSSTFGDELTEDEADWREHAAPDRRRSTVDQRLDSVTKARMMRMRRG
jgi:predicted RNA-binding protein with PIN domain